MTLASVATVLENTRKTVYSVTEAGSNDGYQQNYIR